MGFVYRESEGGLYTVGTYDGGQWEPDSDFETREAAEKRLRYLNGAWDGDEVKAGVEGETAPVCPLTIPTGLTRFCVGTRCAWWNVDFGMCCVTAAAQTLTRPVVIREDGGYSSWSIEQRSGML